MNDPTVSMFLYKMKEIHFFIILGFLEIHYERRGEPRRGAESNGVDGRG